MSDLPDCLYCSKDQRLSDLMIPVTELGVSTLYLFREQSHRGRCIVTYRGHVNELYELPEAQMHAFMSDVARAAKAIRETFGADKINYGAYSDKLPHLHMHLVPKYRDGVAWGAPFEMMPAEKKHLTDAGYAELIGALKAAL
jgi:diadenosine tetraphosphate (Ap4A) HIT family hydrolase